jgi:hypothetical protein
MIGADIRHGDFVLFERLRFHQPENGRILVIEKLGDEDGLAAWSLKRLILERTSSWMRNEFDEEFDWEPPVLVLRSHNPDFRDLKLPTSDRYRPCG